jgi:hypothetical protein
MTMPCLQMIHTVNLLFGFTGFNQFHVSAFFSIFASHVTLLLSNQEIIYLFISYLDVFFPPVSIDVQHCQSQSFKQVVKFVLPFQAYVSRNVWISLLLDIPYIFSQLSTCTTINLFHYLPITILCVCQRNVDPAFVKIKCLVSILSDLFYFVSDTLNIKQQCRHTQ